MTKFWLISMACLCAALPLPAQTPAAPVPPPPASAPAPAARPAPSLNQDFEKGLRAVKSRLVAGWQSVVQRVDAFLKPPPAPVVVEPLPPLPPTVTPPAPAQLPPAPAQVTKAAPPAPQPQPAPAAPPAQPAPAVARPAPAPPAPPVQSPPPAPAAVASVSQKPPATPAVPATPPAPPPAPPAHQPPVQPPLPGWEGLASTQAVFHPIKTGTGKVRYLMVRSAVAKALSLPELATKRSPLKLEVQRVSKRRDAADASPIPAWSPGYSRYREAAALRITVTSLVPRPMTNLMVRWAIGKVSVGRNPLDKGAYFGAQEPLELKAMEEKVIETPPVVVGGSISTLVGRVSGEMIRGHGVQILIGTNLVAEELTPASIKIPFKNLQPVPK